MKILVTEDLDLWINGYRKYKTEIAKCELEIERITAALSKNGGSVVPFQADKKIQGSNPKEIELYSDWGKYQKRIDDLKYRIDTVNLVIGIVGRMQQSRPYWYTILTSKRDGKTYEEIAEGLYIANKGTIHYHYWDCLRWILSNMFIT